VPTVLLTDRFCSSVKATNGRTDFFDEKVPGLALRVTEQGHRSWCFHFRSPRDGKRARATIGTYPGTSLAAARGKALEARGNVDDGQDPRLVLAGQATAELTVAGLVDLYLAELEVRNVRSKPEIERRLRKNVVPIIGGVKLTALRKPDARNVTRPIIQRGSPIEALRVFEDLRGMVRWATEESKIEINPLDGMAKPAESKARDRKLTDDEIATLWIGLPKSLARSVQCQRIVKLALITAQRSGEVSGMVPAELDLKAREWRLPPERSKNGRGHTIPLSDIAIEIIKDAMADAGEGKPLFDLSSEAIARTILRGNEITKDRPKGRFNIEPWSMHDLRRTALDYMAKLGVQPIVIGAVANHLSVTSANVTFKHYATYDYAKERREALDLWADRLAAIVGAGGAKVLPMKRARR
jgi:integrase